MRSGYNYRQRVVRCRSERAAARAEARAAVVRAAAPSSSSPTAPLSSSTAPLSSSQWAFSSDIVNDKLNDIHNKLILHHGSLLDELPEQKMVIRTLKGHEKVLELGAHIGRNSLVIASILQNSENLVTLESDPLTVERLRKNRDANNLNFRIENSALSVKKLIQLGWRTVPSETLLEGYKWVNTITFSDLQNKYNIIFDTLILDCEGAFYHILLDTPEILDNINLIIMENDYWDHAHKIYIDGVLKSKGFYIVYLESGGWGPCYNNFYEIWKK